MSNLATRIIDGLSAFKIGTPSADGTMPAVMTVAAEVYGGGISFKGAEPSKKDHFSEGNTFPKHIQLKPGEKKATGQIWTDDLDKLAVLMGGTVTASAGKANFKSAANYVGVIKAVSFETAAVEGEATPPSLDIPKARVFIGENFVLNDENVWLGDLYVYPMAAWEMDGVPVPV